MIPLGGFPICEASRSRVLVANCTVKRSCRKMLRTAASCGVTIMTVHAAAVLRHRRNVWIAVVKMSWAPSYCCVTDLAFIAGEQVGVRFASGRDAIMALEAAIYYASVIKYADLPRHRPVALAAVIGGTDMRERLAAGVQAIVAVLARFGGVVVIEADNAPRGCQMAIFAILRRLNVRAVFAFGGFAVMARNTARVDFRVIHMDLRKIY